MFNTYFEAYFFPTCETLKLPCVASLVSAALKASACGRSHKNTGLYKKREDMITTPSAACYAFGTRKNHWLLFSCNTNWGFLRESQPRVFQMDSRLCPFPFVAISCACRVSNSEFSKSRIVATAPCLVSCLVSQVYTTAWLVSSKLPHWENNQSNTPTNTSGPTVTTSPYVALHIIQLTPSTTSVYFLGPTPQHSFTNRNWRKCHHL